jgi:hypothetical protein
MFNTAAQMPVQMSVSIDRLPLAVYSEIGAHLQQIANIQVRMLPQTDREFDYLQSQVGGLSIDCSEVSIPDRQRVSEILEYYSRRYGTWSNK